MAVVALITAIEERLGIAFEDEDIDATTFASVGNLLAYVNKRLSD
jgi:acyl carrier protein